MEDEKKKDMKDPAPVLYLRDSQITEYTDIDFDTVKVGDTITVPLKMKIVSVSKREGVDGPVMIGGDDDDEESSKPKTHKSIDLEIVSKESNRKIAEGKSDMQKKWGGME